MRYGGLRRPTTTMVGSERTCSATPARVAPGSNELATVIEGTWYVGEGTKFDQAKLKAYGPGTFVLIPSGIPHFIEAPDRPVVVQLTGIGKWQTDYLEK
ncbi:MAG: hypothetical protein DMG92_17410 [Acidobacteria bacterium]|nr:MAG: hypothetical protein DMG92_17410 [Acidobacteriota bacterium]